MLTKAVSTLVLVSQLGAVLSINKLDDEAQIAVAIDASGAAMPLIRSTERSKTGRTPNENDHQAGRAGSSDAVAGSTNKTALQVTFDTTCSDCQKWIRTQFRPLWQDTDFREMFKNTFDLKFLANSATRHRQGVELNNVLNCAHSNLTLDHFVTALLCWEKHVEAWVENPVVTGTFLQRFVEIDDLISMCMPKESHPSLKACAKNGATGSRAFELPTGFNEVPWIVIGSKAFSTNGDSTAVYHLKNYLCGLRLASTPPACSATTPIAP